MYCEVQYNIINYIFNSFLKKYLLLQLIVILIRAE